MLGYREWRIRYDTKVGAPVLQSTFVSCLWHEASVTADQPPEDVVVPLLYGNLHGIHACLPRYSGGFLSMPLSYHWTVRLTAIGAVDLSGKVVEHVDGVVRGEHARVLALRLLVLQAGMECACDKIYIVSGPPCGFTGGSKGNEDRRYAALRKACLGKSLGGCGGWLWRMRYAQADPALAFEVMAETTLPKLQAQLCQYYEVPALPDREGPWLAPIGIGPTERCSDGG